MLTAVGIALAGAMLSAAVVISYGLGTGFDRAARAASLPDIIVRFNDKSAADVAKRIRALPDLARFQLRLELTNVGVSFRGQSRGDAVAEVLNPGPDRGYAVVAGHDLSNRGQQVLIEKAFADSWGIHVGDEFYVNGLGPLRVVGLVEAPDNVGFPLAKPRFYISRPALIARFGSEANPQVDLAEIWLRNPSYVNEVLVQARETSFGLDSISYATRSGVRILLDQAAGIVIDLLVALSLIALVTAGVMLAASARAEVQRRLGAIGVRRAVGSPRWFVVLTQVVEALLVSVPAALVGVLAGFLVTVGPSGQLLELLNEPAPRTALVLPLLGAFALAAAAPALGAAWPAWRAGRGAVIGLLRGDVSRRGPDRRRVSRGRALAGLTVLGLRLVGARRARLAATAVTLGLSAGFVLLILSLASELSTLETDPSALGERYALTSYAQPSLAPRVTRLPGVAAASPRYEVTAADSYALGEQIDVIAYPRDHTEFEAPALVSGHRLRGSGEAEVGEGLAQALGLADGSTLALDLPSGGELRLRVSGIVSSLDHDGRVAYIPAAPLLRAMPGVPSSIVVVLKPNASTGAVEAEMTRAGAPPVLASTATSRGAPLVGVLRSILRAVAIVDGLVCLYALIQACALTVQERRRTVAVIRACGAGGGAVARLLAGAALALVVPAAVIGIVLQRLVFGPALSRLAESYASLPLVATGLDIAAVVVGLMLTAAVAVAWVARQAVRESVVEGLAA